MLHELHENIIKRLNPVSGDAIASWINLLPWYTIILNDINCEQERDNNIYSLGIINVGVIMPVWDTEAGKDLKLKIDPEELAPPCRSWKVLGSLGQAWKACNSCWMQGCPENVKC